MERTDKKLIAVVGATGQQGGAVSTRPSSRRSIQGTRSDSEPGQA